MALLIDNISKMAPFKDKTSYFNFKLNPSVILKQLKATPLNKAPGPDGICGRTRSHWAEQLSGVLHLLFQSSLDLGLSPD